MEGSGIRLFLAHMFNFVRKHTKHYIFSNITRRILFLNLAALLLLVFGFLYFNRFRDSLIDAKMESLMIQAEIVSGAIAASVQMDKDRVGIDPEKLLELQAGESLNPRFDGLDDLEFPINPERIAPVLRRLISPIRIRARIYDKEANLLMDSRHLYSTGQVLHYNLLAMQDEPSGVLFRFRKWLVELFTRKELNLEEEDILKAKDGAVFDAVMSALKGTPATAATKNTRGEQVISVAVPVQRFHAVLGVLMLSTQGGDIDRIISNERKAILRVFGVAALANMILSVLLASTIASPLRWLSEAAVRIRRGVKAVEEIPDFSSRQDEIGSLSVAMRDMTRALYMRIEAIESFAADVSHELKNPLTSLRSAVETLPLAKTESDRARLMKVIQHDVRRLDRLITDISDASRLDAELAREDFSRINLKEFLQNLVTASQQAQNGKKNVEIHFHAKDLPQGVKGYYVMGHDLRLGQIMINLIDNARSFVPHRNGQIHIRLSRSGDFNVISVEDNGPGIRAENIERIFERFYTDHPSQDAFGQNSGLGLSISRQIAEAHQGKLQGENILDVSSNRVLGARFILTLPATG